jgi:hypothetical protein
MNAIDESHRRLFMGKRIVPPKWIDDGVFRSILERGLCLGRGAREVPTKLEAGMMVGLKRNHEESRRGESYIHMCNANELSGRRVCNLANGAMFGRSNHIVRMKMGLGDCRNGQQQQTENYCPAPGRSCVREIGLQ